MTAEQALGPFESFAALIDAIQSFDPVAEEQLYLLFDGLFRFQLAGQIEPEYLLDALHAAFLDVLVAVRRGDVRNPGSLVSFCHTVTHRKYVRHVDERVLVRSRAVDPMGAVQSATLESDQILREQQALIRDGLRFLSPRERELLVRFYLDEESRESICEHMRLSVRQFAVIKSRALNQLKVKIVRLSLIRMQRRRAAARAEQLAA
jgi:RNA polymerase sigma-70 factor (ECF subfamily)